MNLPLENEVSAQEPTEYMSYLFMIGNFSGILETKIFRLEPIGLELCTYDRHHRLQQILLHYQYPKRLPFYYQIFEEK